MTTAAEVLALAASKIGVGEDPAGSNRNEFTNWYPMNGQPWCGQWVSWVMAHTGLPLIHYAYTPTGAALFQNGTYGQWIGRSGTIQPGDVIFYQWAGIGRICHTGIVEKPLDDGTFYSIEGNVSDKVMRLHRSRQYVVGFGRPNYAAAGTPPIITPTPVAHIIPVPNFGGRLLSSKRPMMRGADVKGLQHALNRVAGAGLAEDGVLGPKTGDAIRSFQRFFGLEADGVAGPNTKAVLAYMYATK